MDDAAQHASLERLRRLTVAGLLLLVLLLPVYRSRNVRWVELADLSTATFQAIHANLATIPPDTLIELRDDRSTRASFQNALGGLYREAALVHLGGRNHLWIEPVVPGREATDQRPLLPVGAVFELTGSGVLRVR
jgi:hypothetical protein